MLLANVQWFTHYNLIFLNNNNNFTWNVVVCLWNTAMTQRICLHYPWFLLPPIYANVCQHSMRRFWLPTMEHIKITWFSDQNSPWLPWRRHCVIFNRKEQEHRGVHDKWVGNVGVSSTSFIKPWFRLEPQLYWNCSVQQVGASRVSLRLQTFGGAQKEVSTLSKWKDIKSNMASSYYTLTGFSTNEKNSILN